MFGIIRNTLISKVERQASQHEINPDLYLDRAAQNRLNAIKEGFCMIAFMALAAFAFLFWLAYEGWITPNMFK